MPEYKTAEDTAEDKVFKGKNGLFLQHGPCVFGFDGNLLEFEDSSRCLLSDKCSRVKHTASRGKRREDLYKGGDNKPIRPWPFRKYRNVYEGGVTDCEGTKYRWVEDVNLFVEVFEDTE